MCGGSGGGQSGVTRYDWNDTMARYYQGTPEAPGGLLMQAANVASQPYQSYGNGASRVSGFTGDQLTAQQRVRDMTNAGGPTDTLQGRQAAGNIAAGGMLNANQYMGDSPQFRSMLQSGLQDITGAYQQGTAANTTRAFNMGNAFGGSAHQQAVANNEGALAKQLSQYAAGMQNDQFNRSANLMEGALGRQMQAIPLAFQGQGLSSDLINQLSSVGAQGQNLSQAQLNDRLNQWNEQMNWGRQNVDWLGNVLGRAQGSTGVTSSTSGYGASPLQQGLGTALMGYGMLRS